MSKNKKINLTKKIQNTSSDKLINLKLKKKIVEDEDNMNEHITSVLEALVRQISNETKSLSDKDLKKKNRFRITSINRAVQVLKDYPVKVESGYEAKQLKGIGSGIADRIDVILETGTLPELEEDQMVSEESKAVESMMTVSGIGEERALTFYRKFGIKDVQELIKKWEEGKIKVGKNQLTHHMEIGLKYYDDFRIRIPREEIEEFQPNLTKVIKSVDKGLIYEICGSYRRKKATTGDLDINITHPQIKTKKQLKEMDESYMADIIEKLLDEGYIIDHIDQGTTYYKGVILMKEIPRRIDIMFNAYNTYHAAILHSTGSARFNKVLRTVALRKGYTLSQYGLYKVNKGKKEDEPIGTSSEKEIFQILGVEYLKPEDRD